MLYCEECRKGSPWPESIRGEYGKCYICGTVTFCNSEEVEIIKYDDFKHVIDPRMDVLLGKVVKTVKIER